MKKLFVFSTIIIVFILQSCTSYYSCSISSFGNHPQTKTYYLIPEDSLLINDLEYIEYANQLKQRLNEVGYIETIPENAEACIKFSYHVGGKEYERTETTGGSDTFNISNSKTNHKANASANATTRIENDNIKTDANAKLASTSNKKEINQTYTSTYISTTDIYSIPIECNIIAYSRKDSKIIWKLKVSDKHYSNSYYDYSLRKFMPWMLLSAQPYFGTNSEVTSSIKEKEGYKKGLKDPTGNY